MVGHGVRKSKRTTYPDPGFPSRSTARTLRSYRSSSLTRPIAVRALTTPEASVAKTKPV
jgi:hypothetical protein